MLQTSVGQEGFVVLNIEPQLISKIPTAGRTAEWGSNQRISTSVMLNTDGSPGSVGQGCFTSIFICQMASKIEDGSVTPPKAGRVASVSSERRFEGSVSRSDIVNILEDADGGCQNGERVSSPTTTGGVTEDVIVLVGDVKAGSRDICWDQKRRGFIEERQVLGTPLIVCGWPIWITERVDVGSEIV